MALLQTQHKWGRQALKNRGFTLGHVDRDSGFDSCIIVSIKFKNRNVYVQKHNSHLITPSKVNIAMNTSMYNSGGVLHSRMAVYQEKGSWFLRANGGYKSYFFVVGFERM